LNLPGFYSKEKSSQKEEKERLLLLLLKPVSVAQAKLFISWLRFASKSPNR